MARRRYTIDTHPEKERIVKDLVGGTMSSREVARKYQLTPSVVIKYVASRLAGQVSAALLEEDVSVGKTILERIERVLEKLEKLYAACDEYLRDPENPGKYCLGPRSWELDVVYRVMDGKGKVCLRKQRLDRLLETTGLPVHEVVSKLNDPRKFLIDTAAVMGKQLELIAKIQGTLRESVQNNITINAQWTEIKQIIMKATEGHQDVRDAIVEEVGNVLASQA
jgi:transposase